MKTVHYRVTFIRVRIVSFRKENVIFDLPVKEGAGYTETSVVSGKCHGLHIRKIVFLAAVAGAGAAVAEAAADVIEAAAEDIEEKQSAAQDLLE